MSRPFLISACVFIALGVAKLGNAAVVIDMVESSGDVVATASGTLNIDGLGAPNGVTYSGGFVVGTGFSASWTGGIGVGSGGGKASYVISTDVSFSTGGRINADSSSGDFVGFISSSSDRLQIDPGYVSGTQISGTSTWNNETFASLGLTEGTYVVTWGTGENADSLTLNIGTQQAVEYTVGGAVSGLSGTVTLQNNGTDDLVISANGDFTFATALADNSDYEVTVLAQPDGQTCEVAGGIGAISGADVTDVVVTCTDDPVPTYTVGGTVSGLTGSVTLTNNGVDDLVVSANGAFEFATALDDLSDYSVSVSVQPLGQTCSVSNGGGSIAGANVTDVAVDCLDNRPPPVPQNAIPVPVDSNWALMVMTLALMLLGGLMLRRDH